MVKKLSFMLILLIWMILPEMIDFRLMAIEPAQVIDWTYQLQGYPGDSLTTLTQSRFDLVVIDYSRWADEAGEWTANEIAALKSSGPCDDRIVLAYLSVGEAEDYRYYWDPSWVDGSGNPIPGVAPTWLGSQNPDWPGNYKVRYWMPEWQAILFGTQSGSSKSYLDRIIDQGFDGVYMDIIDGFEYWGPSEIGGNNENRQAGSQMIDLVISMADYARVNRGHSNFCIFPQNGSYIIDPDVYPDAPDPVAEAIAQKTRYFEVITGIGAEDTFFIGPADENNPYNPDIWTINLLNQFRDAGKPVLSVEYLTQSNLIASYYSTYSTEQTYVPYATIRDLGTMTINGGFEPECNTSSTPTPTPVATASPVPTWTPDMKITLELDMGAESFGTGDICYLDLAVYNSGQVQMVDLFVLLGAYGQYFSYPDWTDIYHNLTWSELSVSSGTSLPLQIIPAFTMPNVTSSGPYTFYALMFDRGYLDTSHMVSNTSIWEFYLR